VTKALREHLKIRLGIAMSRFGERVGRVTVNLSEVEESHLRACGITVGMKQCVKVQWEDADMFTAIDRAVDRAGRAVAHAVEKEHDRSDILSQLRIARTRKPHAAPILVVGPTIGPRLKRRLLSGPVRK